MMKSIFNEGAIRRAIASIMSFVMMISLISAYVPVNAAASEHPNCVTITVKDENGNAVSDAEVNYSIKSLTTSEVKYADKKVSDEKGVVEILSKDSFTANEFAVTAQVSKDGYKNDVSSVVNRSINSGNENIDVVLESTVISGILVTPYIGEYDGNTHPLVTVSGSKKGDIVTYGVNNGVFSKTVPTEKNIGKYSVTVKVSRSGYEDYTVAVNAEISQGTIKNVNIVPFDGKYDGNNHDAVTITGIQPTDSVKYSYNGENLDSVPVIVDAGEYAVTVTIKRINYEDYVKKVTARIVPTAIDGLTIQPKEGLVYSGSEQELIVGVNGVQTGDKIEYSKDNENWSEKKPTGVNAGEYTVHTRVTRNKNYTITYLPDVKVTIDKKNISIKFKKEPVTSIACGEGSSVHCSFGAAAKDNAYYDGKITYSVDFAENAGNTDEIGNVATIDSDGLLTITQNGFSVKITVNLESDNYTAEPLETTLIVTNPETKNLVKFDENEILYVLGTSTTIAEQGAKKTNRRDGSKVSYRITAPDNSGVAINSSTGKVTVASYDKLASLMSNSKNKELQLTVQADKGEYTIGGKIVYSSDTARYTIVIKFADAPEVKVDETTGVVETVDVYTEDDNKFEADEVTVPESYLSERVVTNSDTGLYDVYSYVSGGTDKITLAAGENKVVIVVKKDASYNVYEKFEDEKPLFKADSRITVKIEDDATLNSKVVGFTCAGNAGNGYSFAHYALPDTVTKDIVTFDFDYYNTNGGRAILSIGDATTRGTTGGSTKVTYNSTGAIFNLGSNKTNALVQGDSSKAIGDYTNKWMHVNVVVNQSTKKVSYTITNKADGAEIAKATDVAFVDATTENLKATQIDIFGYINNSHCAMLDNIKVTESDATTSATE